MPVIALAPAAIHVIGTLGLGVALSLGLISQQQYNDLRRESGGQDIIRPGTPEYDAAFGRSGQETAATTNQYDAVGGLSDKQKEMLGMTAGQLANIIENKYAPETDRRYAETVLNNRGVDFSVQWGTDDLGYPSASVTFNEDALAPRGAGVEGEGTYKDNELPAFDPNTGAYRGPDGKFTSAPPKTEAGAQLGDTGGALGGAEEYTGGIDTSGYQQTITVDPNSDNRKVLDEYVGAGIYNQPTTGLDGQLTYTLNPEGARDNERRRNLLTWGENITNERVAGEGFGDRAAWQQSQRDAASAAAQAAGGAITEQYPGRGQTLPYVSPIADPAVANRQSEQFGERAAYEQAQRDAAAAAAQAEAGQVREQFPGREQGLPYVSLLTDPAVANRQAEQRGDRAAYEQSLRDAAAAQAQADAGAIREQFPGREATTPYVSLLTDPAVANRQAEQAGERDAWEQAQRDAAAAQAQAQAGAVREQYPGREQTLPYVSLLTDPAVANRQSEQFGERAAYEQAQRDAEAAAAQAAGGAITEQYPTRGQSPLVGTQYWNPAETGDANRGGEQRGERGRYLATLPETTQGGLLDAPSIVDREGDTLTTRTVQDIINAINSATSLEELNNTIAAAGGINDADPAVIAAYNNALTKFTPTEAGSTDAGAFLMTQAQERDAAAAQAAAGAITEQFPTRTESAAAVAQTTAAGGGTPGGPDYSGVAAEGARQGEQFGERAAYEAELAELEAKAKNDARLKAVDDQLMGILGQGGSEADVGQHLTNVGGQPNNGFTRAESIALMTAGAALISGQGIGTALGIVNQAFAKTEADREQKLDDKRTILSSLLASSPNASITLDDGTEVPFGDLDADQQRQLLDSLADAYVNDPDEFVRITTALGIKGFGVPGQTTGIDISKFSDADQEYLATLAPEMQARLVQGIRSGDWNLKDFRDGKVKLNNSLSAQIGLDTRLGLKTTTGNANEPERRAILVQAQLDDPEFYSIMANYASTDWWQRRSSDVGKWFTADGLAAAKGENELLTMLSMLTYGRTGAALNEQEQKTIQKEYKDLINTTPDEFNRKLQRLTRQHGESMYRGNYEMNPMMLLLKKFDYDWGDPEFQKLFGSQGLRPMVQRDGKTYVNLGTAESPDWRIVE